MTSSSAQPTLSPPAPSRADDETIYSVQLPLFEGPLDLLLHLCQKHELDILEIPIAFITEKYLEYLALMRLVHLDVAAEYLLMAATLAHIKSKMLLPDPPEGQEEDGAEDEEDPREALIRRLLEYQKYKHAAADLLGRDLMGRDVFSRGATTEEVMSDRVAPLASIPIFALIESFERVLKRSSITVSHDVVADRISITDRIHELVVILSATPRVEFTNLLEDLVTRFDLVITFLACLEMTRLRMVRLIQTGHLGPIYVELLSDRDRTE